MDFRRCAIAACGVFVLAGATAAEPVARIVEHVIPTPGARPYIVVVGPDGAIWFCESGASKYAAPEGR